MNEHNVVSSIAVGHFLKVHTRVLAGHPSIDPSKDCDWTKEDTLYACESHALVTKRDPELAYMTNRGWVFITSHDDGKAIQITARTIGDADVTDIDQAVKAIDQYFN